MKTYTKEQVKAAFWRNREEVVTAHDNRSSISEWKEFLLFLEEVANRLLQEHAASDQPKDNEPGGFFVRGDKARQIRGGA